MDVGYNVPDINIEPAHSDIKSDETTDGSRRQLVTRPSSARRSKTRAMASEDSNLDNISRNEKSLLQDVSESSSSSFSSTRTSARIFINPDIPFSHPPPSKEDEIEERKTRRISDELTSMSFSSLSSRLFIPADIHLSISPPNLLIDAIEDPILRSSSSVAPSRSDAPSYSSISNLAALTIFFVSLSSKPILIRSGRLCASSTITIDESRFTDIDDSEDRLTDSTKT